MDVEQKIERESREQIERTRRFLNSQCRPDLVAELDANLKDVRLGITQARGIWHALSTPQREALDVAGARNLDLLWGNTSAYGFRDSAGRGNIVAYRRTLIPLCARGLLTADNVIPPRQFQITEHGRFVLKKGRDVAPVE